MNFRTYGRGRERIFKALFVAAVLLAGRQLSADTFATVRVEGRGLPIVDGILRDNPKANWGFVNFIAFGPGWQYSAQDYAASGHKKSAVRDEKYGDGLLFTAKMYPGGRGIDIREEVYDISKGGGAKARFRWTISSQDGKAMRLERAYLRFPLSEDEFAGGTVAGRKLPLKFEQEWIDVGDKSGIEIVSKDGAKKLRLALAAGNAVIADARKEKQPRFELRIEFAGAKDQAKSVVEFEVQGVFADSRKRAPGRVALDLPPPPVKLAAGNDWCAFPYTNRIRPGTILDFSTISFRDAPAGKYGFAAVTKDGHIAFEKRAAPVRFVGGNLCFDANFLSKEECARVVEDFVRRGWNTVRFHHIDVTITKDEWNNLWGRRTYPEISPEKLDRLDFLLAEFKKAGIYATFDLYAMGGLGSCEGFDRPLNSNTVKAVVPIHRPAEDQWFRRAMEIFDHKNPYTGLKWKDDPAVLFVTLMNEDSIASVWWGAADLYVRKYNEWAKKKGYREYPKKDIAARREFAEFLYEVKAQANVRMAKRLKNAGVRSLISGGNWWDNMAQAYERDALEIVDNHGYGDHPQPSYQKMPFHINQSSNIKSGNPAYNEPMMKAPSRILGKPFAITEFNFCAPSRLRAEGGLMMGAYAALQDWDALYRFAWSHSRAALSGTHAVSGFDNVRDPVGQLTERQIVLLFARGDVSPAREVFGYGVTKEESLKGGLGDMWAKGLFPYDFTDLGYTSRIGSYVADDGRTPVLPCTKTWTAANRSSIPKFKGEALSDTKEIYVSTRRGDITVNTPRTAAVCSTDRNDLSAGPLTVSGATTFCSVSASAMDSLPLASSRRILLLHITDVQNTDAEFTNAKMTDTKSWGKLPYLAKTGSAVVRLRNLNRGLKVYALASDGSRLRRIPADYTGGAYVFKAEVAPGEGAGAPTMMYEISAK